MTTTPPGTLTIRNALIFDGEARNLIEGSITVREGRITEVGRDVEEAGKIVDADGRTVIDRKSVV